MKDFLGYGRTRSSSVKGDVVKRHFNEYVNCLHAQVGTARENMEVLVAEFLEPIGCAMRGRNPENSSDRGRSNGKYKQRIEMGSNISNTTTSVQKDSLVAEPVVQEPYNADDDGCEKAILAGCYKFGAATLLRKSGATMTSVIEGEPLRIPQATKQGYVEVQPGGLFDMSYPESKTRRGRVQEGGTVSPTLMASGEAPCLYEGIKNMTNEEAGLFKDSNKTYSVYSVHPTSGLEFSFNEHLQGTAGWQMRQKINRNFWSPVDSPYNVEPQDGCDVVTTLDMDVQDIAESMLEE